MVAWGDMLRSRDRAPQAGESGRFNLLVLATDLAGVGAGSFWTGMVDYAGGRSAEDVASEIQKSWDALK